MAASESECFFVYSADPSLTYLLIPGNSPPDYPVLRPSDPELVGKVWEGTELEIKGPETVMPKTVGPASLPIGPASLLGSAKISDKFCRPAARQLRYQLQ